MRLSSTPVAISIAGLVSIIALAGSCKPEDKDEDAPRGSAGSAGSGQSGGSGGSAGGPGCPAADYLAGKPIPSGGTTHDGSDVGSQTWRAADSPHRVLGDNTGTFGAGTSLTIEPCALVVMGPTSALVFGPSSDSGDLIAVGNATHPIVITSASPEKDAWSGIFLGTTTAATALSHVTVERATGPEGASVFVTGTSSPRIDHTTIRDGAGHGIEIADRATFGAGSVENVVSGMGATPVVLHVTALSTFPDGSYRGNADDRIEVRHDGGDISSDVTWPKRSVSYLLDSAILSITGKLTIEPGVHVFVEDLGTWLWEATFQFVHGGSLVADGAAETSRIVFEGEKGNRWHGFAFRVGEPTETPSGPGLFNFVTIKHAGAMPAGAGDPSCIDNHDTTTFTAIDVEHDVVDVEEHRILRHRRGQLRHPARVLRKRRRLHDRAVPQQRLSRADPLPCHRSARVQRRRLQRRAHSASVLPPRLCMQRRHHTLSDGPGRNPIGASRARCTSAEA
jgi:hypothetical protein